jgi:hypothetical protein
MVATDVILFCTLSRPVLGSNVPFYQTIPVGKRPEREANHSPLSTVDVKSGQNWDEFAFYCLNARYTLKSSVWCFHKRGFNDQVMFIKLLHMYRIILSMALHLLSRTNVARY